MNGNRLREAARALGEMPLYGKHEIGEVQALTLRDFLEQISLDEASDDISVEDALLEMARIAIEAYGRG